MGTDTGLTGLVSIHDVMPRTLPEVRELLRWLGDLDVNPVTLLVVPGAGWSTAELDELREWEHAGCELAGHGWIHQAEPRSLFHRIHSFFVSRDVAEHLALDQPGIADLINRCHGWFGEHGFREPALYVAPAWAMGAIDAAALQGLPFQRYEYLGGILDAKSGNLRKVPMVGFEADRWWRKAAVATPLN